MSDTQSKEELLDVIARLSRRLDESEDVVHAIRSGAVDALVVSLPEGEHIFTLQGAEHPYRVLVETMNEGAATLAPDGTIVYSNRCLAAMLQVPIEKLMGSPLDSFVAPEDRPFFAARLKACADECDKREILLIAGTGKRIPVLFSCCAGADSAQQGVSVILTDISTLKAAEETIVRLNRLHAVLSATNHATVHASDRDSLFREICRVAVELGGFRLAWVGLFDKETGSTNVVVASGETAYLEGVRFSHEDPEGMGSSAMAVSEGIHLCNDFSTSAATGSWRRRAELHGLCSSASIVIKEEAEVIGALTLYADQKNFFEAEQVDLLRQIGADVSFALDNIHQGHLRRQAEKALQEETLARLRAVEELREKERLLVQQSRHAALGEMIGNIAHQWRQPLNALGLLVQQVSIFHEMGELDNEFLRQNVAKSMEVINHMSRTIDDFRNFFQPDKERSVFAVRQEVAKTLSLIQAGFQAQQILIEVRATCDPSIYGYANEFSQVLLNILVNAKDALTERKIATPKVVITIGTEEDRVVVTIRDNAGGIPEEIIGKIFDPYFTTKGPQSGTGVGLYMSKTIIEKNMGGILTARNVEDGAEFEITI